MNKLITVVVDILKYVGNTTECCSAWGFYNPEKPNKKEV